MADDKKARELLEKIRRLPHNKRCVNCDTEAPPGGFGDVCVKFLTFTCHTCKSAHQSFSHRCKSVSLSNWTTHEVLALKDEAGGGNAHARKTWLGKLEGVGLVLAPGDPLDKVKAFVDEAYNRKRYWRDDADAHSSNSSSSRPTTQGNHSGATPSSSGRASGVRPPTPPLVSISTKDPFEAGKPAAPAAAPADFLDFGADFSAVPVAQKAGAAANGGGGGEEEWQPFQQHSEQGNGSAASAFAYIAAPPAPASHAADDHFGDFMTAPGPAPRPPLPMPQQAFNQQQQQQQPVMLLGVRALGDDPFAGLQSHPPQHSAFGPRPTPVGMGMGMGMNPYGQQPQQQRPSSGMGVGMGMMPMAASRPPMGGMGMHSHHPSMNGFAAPTPTPAQRSRPVPMGGGMGGGVGGFSSTSSSSYKPHEPDPFASLDAVWRNK